MIEKNDNLSEFFSLIAPIVIIAVLILAWICKHLYPEKKYKSEVAEDYGVSKYTISKWTESFCPTEVVQKYVGERIQKITLKDIEPHLGKPSDIPFYFKGGKVKTQIISKDDLWKAYHNMSDRTLLRRIKAIENPMETIRMSHETYLSLKSFPPSKMNLICNYLESLGYKRKKEALSQITRHSDRLVA